MGETIGLSLSNARPFGGLGMSRLSVAMVKPNLGISRLNAAMVKSSVGMSRLDMAMVKPNVPSRSEAGSAVADGLGEMESVGGGDVQLLEGGVCVLREAAEN